jgi:putative endonuclease
MTPLLLCSVGLRSRPDIMKRVFHVYILSNVSRMLYVGVTNDLERRTYEHKHKLVPGFSTKYNLHRLVYFEAFGHIGDAIAREKQLKGWLRSKKLALIESTNPEWNDLAADWFKAPKTAKTRAQDIQPTNATTTRPVSS